MDLSRIGKYFFVLYIYILAWELIGLIFVEWYNFDTFEGRTKEFCLWGEEDWKGMSPRISFLTKFWIYFESMKRIWTNLIFGKIMIGFERIENDPINYLNSKTLKRPRYLYESLISVRNIRWKLFLETLLKFSPIRNTCCCFFVARCLVPTFTRNDPCFFEISTWKLFHERHATRSSKVSFRKISGYEIWKVVSTLRSTIDFAHSSEKSSHSLSATYAQDPISKRERSLSYGQTVSTAPFSGGGPRWYRGEA